MNQVTKRIVGTGSYITGYHESGYPIIDPQPIAPTTTVERVELVLDLSAFTASAGDIIDIPNEITIYDAFMFMGSFIAQLQARVDELENA